MTNISTIFQGVLDMQERLASEKDATTLDLSRLEEVVAGYQRHLTGKLAAFQQSLQHEIDDVCGVLLRDLRAIREARATAIDDAIGPVPPVIEAAAQQRLEAAE